MDKGRILIDEETLATRINELAKEITKEFEGEQLTVICILKGSIYFFADLTRRIDLDTRVEFIRISSYDGENSTGDIDFKLKLDEPVTGKNVLIVEDIIDTGHTLKALMDYLGKQEPKKMKLCTLLDKPSRREEKNINVDFLGFTINNHFVIGYGLDNNEKYRTIPTINCIPSSLEEMQEIDKDREQLKLIKKQ